ncbi:MAG: protein-glutamate O-methyltransferase CheR [Alcaligenaceae bacterium]
MNASLVLAFCGLLEANVGISLDLSKEYLIRARLEPLAKENGFTDYEKLLQKLVVTPLEPLHWKCFEAMATHETFFFRDGYPFEMIRETLLPALITARQDVKRLNIWCAAASTGQEPYSIAMILEDFQAQLKGWSVNILATDISATALQVGRKGVYSALDANRGLTKVQLDRFFSPNPCGSYQLSRQVMSCVEFRTLNLITSWGALPKFDLILIRNALIYFNRTHRDLVLNKMHQQLNDEKSYLMLGSSESIFSEATQYQNIRIGRGSVYCKSNH